MKKILSVLMSFCTLFFMPIGKVNAEDFIKILVVCEEKATFDTFSQYINRYGYDARLEEVVDSETGFAYVKEGIDKREVILEPLIFNELKKLSDTDVGKFVLDKLNHACQTVILYDISDSSLDEIVENNSKVQSDNLQEILHHRTFLNDCLNLFLSEHLQPIWFKSFNFFTFDSTNSLSKQEYDRRRNSINFYTVYLEHKLNLPNSNIWGRGHANYLECKNAFFGSFAGNLNAFEIFESEKIIQDEKKRRTQRQNQNHQTEPIVGATAGAGSQTQETTFIMAIINAIINVIKKFSGGSSQ